MKTDFKKCIFYLTVFSLILFTACGPKEHKKIPLVELDPNLKSKGNAIAKDIILSLTHEDGANYLLTKNYATPLVHGRIKQNAIMYIESYEMANLAIGKVSKYKLFQVLDKGVIKSMRYQLTTDAESLEFVELKIDINLNNDLADYYLYLTSKDGMLKRENILPQAVK